MTNYSVSTRNFTTTITTDIPPMVPLYYARGPKDEWGGTPESPMYVNNAGEFKTRQQIFEIYATSAHFALTAQGWDVITSFAAVNAQEDEDLETYEANGSFTGGLIASFLPWCEHREYSVINSNKVLNSAIYGVRSLEINIPYQEVTLEGDNEATYVAYAQLDGATYKVIINEYHNG